MRWCRRSAGNRWSTCMLSIELVVVATGSMVVRTQNTEGNEKRKYLSLLDGVVVVVIRLDDVLVHGRRRRPAASPCMCRRGHFPCRPEVRHLRRCCLGERGAVGQMKGCRRWVAARGDWDLGFLVTTTGSRGEDTSCAFWCVALDGKVNFHHAVFGSKLPHACA